ncbi:MAG: hypothetical protein MJE68_30165 [Proteobacteria bacterium]|nr:hypothetical protein [Pseudomonadota bacterium]
MTGTKFTVETTFQFPIPMMVGGDSVNFSFEAFITAAIILRCAKLGIVLDFSKALKISLVVTVLHVSL